MSEEKTGIDWPLERKAFRRVWRDLRWPGAIALVIALYNSSFTRADWFKDVSFFFTTWFFAAAYFSYYQRSKKLVIDERNHTDVVGKQDALTTRLETLSNDLAGRQAVLVDRLENLTDEIAGHTTGGKGFCYVWLVRTAGSSIRELNFSVDGKYPIQGAHLGLSNFESLGARYKKADETGDLQVLMAYDFEQSMATLLPRMTYFAKCDLVFKDQTKIRLHLHWKANNGTWYQRIQMERRGETWVQATFVQRDHELIFSKADDDYPCDPDGNPVFQEYENTPTEIRISI